MSRKSTSAKKSGRNKVAPAWLKERPLGEALRINYEETLKEPIPRSLNKLVVKLQEKETKR